MVVVVVVMMMMSDDDDDDDDGGDGGGKEIVPRSDLLIIFITSTKERKRNCFVACVCYWLADLIILQCAAQASHSTFRIVVLVIKFFPGQPAIPLLICDIRRGMSRMPDTLG
ncbi:hypothetical protein PoB_005770900 [Plakobranchus ocellatus]|uniref:Secreted protein n=1 Tax=Plakobranchus ocellatus TaxID=259542 RepID=A0AAV4CEY6_9GAST|nr:hypothetical protein PoB_005770900 [Plakobranchus ocellatus]